MALFYVFYYLLHFTLGILQNIMGFCLFLKYSKCKKEFYHGSILVYHNGNWGGVSLGIFIFVNGNRDEEWTEHAKPHEYGHTIQSMFLGILYFPIIAIPSVIWCNSKYFINKRKEKDISYFSFYPERNADWCGRVFTKR